MHGSVPRHRESMQTPHRECPAEHGTRGNSAHHVTTVPPYLPDYYSFALISIHWIEKKVIKDQKSILTPSPTSAFLELRSSLQMVDRTTVEQAGITHRPIVKHSFDAASI